MPAMNSRRLIRSSSQIEDDGTEYHVAIFVALIAGRCGVWAQDRYGSKREELNMSKSSLQFFTERTSMRWGTQKPIPNVSDAIRQLIEIGLKAPRAKDRDSAPG